MSKPKTKPATKRPAIPGAIELGDTARDEITGFEGVVIAITLWIDNCDRVLIQPQKLQVSGEPEKSQMFDRPSCLLIEKGTIRKRMPETGGPKPEPTRHADPGR